MSYAPRLIKNEKWTMNDEQWSINNQQWTTCNGPLTMNN